MDQIIAAYTQRRGMMEKGTSCFVLPFVDQMPLW